VEAVDDADLRILRHAANVIGQDETSEMDDQGQPCELIAPCYRNAAVERYTNANMRASGDAEAGSGQIDGEIPRGEDQDHQLDRRRRGLPLMGVATLWGRDRTPRC
jgi:hypothetical protein